MTTAIDVINAKNGTYTAGQTAGATGLVSGDGACLFTAAPAGIGSMPTDTFPPTSTTMSFIMFLARQTDGSGLILIEFFSAKLVWGCLDSGFGRIPFADIVGSPTARISGATAIPADSSVHLLGLTRNGTSWKIYVDGSLDGSATITPLFGTTPLTYIIGEGDTFVGDELATFTSELSATDMANLWAARTSYAAFNAAVLALSPYNYWHLDELGPFPAVQPGWYINEIAMAG